MPEQHSPELDHSFDDVFDALVRDVGGVTHPRGAAAAVRTSRRRRAALAGGLAAAVLAVGGITWAGHPSDGGPDSRGSDVAGGTLPDPAPFDAGVLEDVLGGSWREDDSPVLSDPACVGGLETQPRDAESVEFGSGRRLGAAFTTGRFASEADASAAAHELVEGWDACDPTPGGPVTLPGGAFGWFAAFGPREARDPARDQVLVQIGDRIALLTVVHERDAGTPVDFDDAADLGRAVAADLLVEDDD